MTDPKPLCVIPTYVTNAHDVELCMTTVRTLKDTADADVCIVDDGSPDDDLRKAMAEAMREEYGATVVLKNDNEGFSKTVNVGLRWAHEEERDAVLVNADIEFFEEGWLERMVKQETEDGEGLASIVGGLLLYPNGLIQHGGVYFSLLHRWFDHIYKHGPADLPEAQHARRCPVTGALQFIRWECLDGLGFYDEKFLMGWEDVDYCIRAFKSGRDVVYQPKVRAIHHESIFRGRQSKKLQDWQGRSWFYFAHKWRNESFADFVPSII